MAPGERGRAMLAVGEALAARSPWDAAKLLTAAVSPLLLAGDEIGAAQAAILAVLATADPDQAGTVPLPPSLPGWLMNTRPLGLPEAWDVRLAAARRISQGEPPPADLTDPSPELRWRTASSSDPAAEGKAPAGSGLAARRPGAPTGLGVIRWGWLLGGGVVAFAALVTDSAFYLDGLSSSNGPSLPPALLFFLGVVVTGLALLASLGREVALRIGRAWHFASPPWSRLEFNSAEGTVFVTGCRPAVVNGGEWAGHVAVSRVIQLRIDDTWPPSAPRLPVVWKRPLIVNIDADQGLDDRAWE